MGLVDRLKTYLNEEEEKNKPSSERGTADNRVHLQYIDEVEKDGVSVSFSQEGTKAAAKNAGKSRNKKSSKKQSAKQSEIKNAASGRTAEKSAQGDRLKKLEKYAEASEKNNDDPVKKPSVADFTSETEEEPSKKKGRKESRKIKKKHKKAARRLEKAIKKKKNIVDDGTSRYGKLNDGSKSRAGKTEMDKVIFGKSTYEDAERQTVTDFCEQLVDVSYHMEDMEREYQTVTTYLEDIQRIEALPDEYRGEIIDIAVKIEQLSQDKETYLESENLLPQEQYSTLAKLEKEVPGTIEKLSEMEERDSLLRRDMGYLEGEKADLKFMRGEYTDSIARIRGVMTTLLILGFVTLGVISVVAMMSKSTVTVYVLAVVAFVVVVFAIGYVRYISVSNDVRINDARLSKAVSLLNKVKVKYINNTNTMEYIYDKYGINSVNELEYSWEQYNTMVRDMLKYSDANKDIRRLNEELLHTLRKYGIHEPQVWMSQVRALADPREMVEIRHALNKNRQKLRESIALSRRIQSNAVTALRASVAENPGMAELIQDILAPYHLSIL